MLVFALSFDFAKEWPGKFRRNYKSKTEHFSVTREITVYKEAITSRFSSRKIICHCIKNVHVRPLNRNQLHVL